MKCKSCVYYLKVISKCEECIHCSARRTEIPAVDNYEESDICIGKERWRNIWYSNKLFNKRTIEVKLKDDSIVEIGDYDLL